MQSSLKGHRAYDLSHFDDSLWQQSEIALSSCQTTLNELNVLVAEIRQGAGKAVLGRRARLAAALTSKAAELQGFRDRIAKSNLALQTILQTITVSLSLRNNVSQTLVLRALDDLKASIDSAISRSWQNSNGANRIHEGAMHFHADAQLNRNLRDLAQAAKQFHSAASSTASSAANSARSDDGGSNAPWQSYPGADMSLFGDFSDDLRERVEEYVRDAPAALNVEEPRKRQKTSFPRGISPDRVLATMKEEENESAEEEDDEEDSDEEDDAEFELAFVKGLQELISHHIRAGNYTKAVDFINEAMSNSAVSSCNNLLRTLQSQLVLAHLLQGQWRLASSLLTTTLAGVRKDRDAVVCSLLHGLAIAYLTEYAFDDALAVCKMALYGRRRLHKKEGLDVKEVNETTGLFATIYDMTGDYVRAEVLRGQLPSDFVYSHPQSAITFLLQEETLKELLQGEMKMSKTDTMSVVPGIFELADRADNPAPGLVRRATTTSLMSPLRTRICEHERLERDTTKEVVIVEPATISDADDEASPVTDEESPVVAPLRRRLTQIFKSSRPRRPVAAKPVQEEEEDNDSGYGTSSPVESASPPSPWRLRDFSPLKRTKTKKLLKRQPLKKEKGRFKVLNMERVAKVDAPKQPMVTPVGSPVVEDELWKPRWNGSAQLAELDATIKERGTEEQSILGFADQPAPETTTASRAVHWSDTTVADATSDEAPSSTSTASTASNPRPAKLQIPEPSTSHKEPPLSIPSLDAKNLTHQPLSPRLTDALSSLSHCFTSIPDLKTSDEMDGIRIQLCYLLAELHACGYDRTLEGDVEAAVARLRRESSRMKRRAEREEEKKATERRKAEEKRRGKTLSVLAPIEERSDEKQSPWTTSDESSTTKSALTSDATTDMTPQESESSMSSPLATSREIQEQQRKVVVVPHEQQPSTSASVPDDERDTSDNEPEVVAVLDHLRSQMLRHRFSFERLGGEVLEVGKS